MKCPPGELQSSKEYHKFKNFHSIVPMDMVDYQYRFVWASRGFPGNSHDAIIFKSTDLWLRIQTLDNPWMVWRCHDSWGLYLSFVHLAHKAIYECCAYSTTETLIID